MSRLRDARGRARSACAPEEYWADIEPIPLLSPREERELPALVAAGDRGARARMVEANLRLVIAIAAEYAGHGVDLEDLIEEGNMGLLRAVEDYRTDRGAEFGTYAGFWIRQSMRRAIMGQGRALRLPAYMLALLARWMGATDRLEHELGRRPRPDEVAASAGIGPAAVASLEAAVRVRRSGGLGLSMFADVAASPEPPLERLIAAEDWERVRGRLGALEGREAAVIRLRYGLGGEAPLTLAEVGRRLGICRERARQLERSARRRLAGD